MSSPSLKIRPVSGSLGAELSGVNLAEPISSAVFDGIRDALHTHGVVFFRDQVLSREQQLALANKFGKPEVHPIANGMAEHPEVIAVRKPAGEQAFFGTSWHTDNSFFERPTAYTILYGEIVPAHGGDTEFASMHKAYERLSDGMKAFLDPMVAVHSASRAYDPRTTGEAKYRGEGAMTYTYSDSIHDEVEHPIVRTHVDTGRKSLYVNPMFTIRIKGLHPIESEAILQMLHAHATQPDFTCRFSWQPGSVAIWDNRCVQHYAINDYQDADRLMYRVTISGERPV